MSCEWLERVAIAMDDEWTDEVQRHVNGCPECAGLLEDREWLRSAPPLPDSVVPPIRLPQRRRSWWPAAIAAALAAIAVGGGIGWQVLQPVEAIRAQVKHPSAPAVLTAVAALHEEQRPLPVRRRSIPRQNDPERLVRALATALNERPREQGLRLYTEDPDVVILLVPEAKGAADD